MSVFSNSLSFSYSFRNLTTRKGQSVMTLAGIALVVFVFVATLMLAKGLETTLSETGSKDNAIAISNGAQNEVQSGISREGAGVILSQPEVFRLEDGSTLSTSDLVVLVSLKKISDSQPGNVTIRGVNSKALQVRTDVKLKEGRLPNPGSREVMVGEQIKQTFLGTKISDSIRLVGADWTVVGTFDAGNSGFNSEIWGDADIFIPTFRRENFSSVTFRLAPEARGEAEFQKLKERLEADKRFSVTLFREQEFYEMQSKSLAKFIRIIGSFISVIFSVAAIVGATITMYGTVSNRRREIGILRAIGYSRWTIFWTFLKEACLISLVGSLVGILIATGLIFVKITSTNFQTFSEVVFGFSITPFIALEGILFGLAMGVVGGVLPAIRAARIKVVDAIRLG